MGDRVAESGSEAQAVLADVETRASPVCGPMQIGRAERRPMYGRASVAVEAEANLATSWLDW